MTKQQRESLAQTLVESTTPGHKNFDPVFNKAIRELRPDWFSKYTPEDIAKEIFDSSLTVADVIIEDVSLPAPLGRPFLRAVPPGWGGNLKNSGYSCILSNWEIDRDEYEDVDDYIEFNKGFIQEELDRIAEEREKTRRKS